MYHKRGLISITFESFSLHEEVKKTRFPTKGYFAYEEIGIYAFFDGRVGR